MPMPIQIKQNQQVLDQKRLEAYQQLAEVIQFGRRNVVEFCKIFLG
jgi:hypothetical protein